MVFEKSRFSQGQDNLHDHKNPGIIKLDKNVKIRYVTETQQSSSSKVVEDDNDQHKFKSVSMDEKNKINIAHTFQKRDNNNSKKMQNLIAGIKQIGVKQSINKAINQTKSVSELNILDNEFRRNQGQVQGSEGHNTQKNKAEQLNMGAVMANGGDSCDGDCGDEMVMPVRSVKLEMMTMMVKTMMVMVILVARMMKIERAIVLLGMTKTVLKRMAKVVAAIMMVVMMVKPIGSMMSAAIVLCCAPTV